jgi:hypothetical protein
MTPRNLFNIVLKILGLFFIRDLFMSLPQLLSVILYFKTGQTEEALWTLISSAIVIAVEIYICYYLIFRSEWIMDKLKLTDGFDQEAIPLNIHRSTVLSISVIVIGGLMLTDEIPNLCRRVFSYFQQRRLNYSEYSKETPYIVLSIVKIILALLILSENRRIVSLILRKTRTEL